MHTIKDLGPLTHPMAVNDAGQVVGYADIDITGHIHHAFFWDSGNLINLDDNWPPHTEAAFSVNKDGQVVGSTALISDLTPSTGLLAFFCGEPLANNPTLLPLDKVTSIARGINKLSAIVGHRQLPGERWQPVYWPSYKDLPTLLASTQPGLGGKAAAINEHGVIVGRASVDNIGNFVGCLWRTFQDPPQRLEPPPGFPQSYAWAVNDNGPVEGNVRPSVVGIYGPGVANGENPIERLMKPIRYGCRWDPVPDKGEWKYAVKPLFSSLVNSFAFGINKTGDMVGTFFDPLVVDPKDLLKGQRAFYSASDWPQPLDLTNFIENNPGWTLKVARGINKHGQIVGEGIIKGQTQTHGFLLTPAR